MPGGAGPNADALYLYWTEEATGRLYWSKATVDGVTYAAWSTPTNQAGALARNWSLATAPDAQNQAIIVGYYDGATLAERIARHPASADTTWPLLVQASSRLGYLMSLAVDGSHVYVFYQNSSGQLVYRRYLEGTGWDESDRLLDSATSAWYPSARLEVSGGQTEVVYTRTNAQNRQEAAHCRVTTSRPFVCILAASPSSCVPLAGQSATISYALGDDVSPVPTVTVKVYDSQNALGRTLANGSQATGAQSVAWDVKNDSGAILATGSYTVKVNATDGDNQQAVEATTSVSITRQATTSHRYDVNRGLPVVLDDGTRKYVWGLGLAYAVDNAAHAEQDLAIIPSSIGGWLDLPTYVYRRDGKGSLETRLIFDRTSPTPSAGLPVLTRVQPEVTARMDPGEYVRPQSGATRRGRSHPPGWGGSGAGGL